jgi:hypothetical protein
MVSLETAFHPMLSPMKQLCNPFASIKVRSKGSKSPALPYPAEPYYQERNEYPDPIDLYIRPLRMLAINHALSDLNGDGETENIPRSGRLLGQTLAQQQGKDSSESEQPDMEKHVPSSMGGRPKP